MLTFICPFWTFCIDRVFLQILSKSFFVSTCNRSDLGHLFQCFSKSWLPGTAVRRKERFSGQLGGADSPPAWIVAWSKSARFSSLNLPGKVTFLLSYLCHEYWQRLAVSREDCPAVTGRAQGTGHPKACRNPRSSWLKIIPSCFVVCLHKVAVSAIALGLFPSKLPINKYNSKLWKQKISSFPLSPMKDRLPSPVMYIYPNTKYVISVTGETCL